MSSFYDGLVSGTRQAFCAYLGVSGNTEKLFNRLSPVDLPPTSQFWNRVLCDREEPPSPPSPPFTGGQCSGVLYDVFLTTDYRGTFAPQCSLTTSSGVVRGLGPVSFVGVIKGPGGDEDEYESTVRVEFADGPQNFGSTFTDNECAGYEITSVNIVRVDGQPDTCGDPPPIIPPFPPGGEPTPITIEYTNNEGDTVIELGDLTIFAPVVITPVTITVPVRFDLPDFNFNGAIDIGPDFDINVEPPPFRRGPGDIETPPPSEDPDTSPTTPEDDSSRRVIGAIATVTSDPSDGLATEVASVDGPDLFVPRMGTLSFRVRAASSLSWTEPVDIKTTRQFIPAPANVQTLAAVASPNPNYSISVTLVYGDFEP